jgi:hypothetical protein
MPSGRLLKHLFLPLLGFGVIAAEEELSNSDRPGRSGEASGILPRQRCPLIPTLSESSHITVPLAHAA